MLVIGNIAMDIQYIVKGAGALKKMKGRRLKNVLIVDGLEPERKIK